MPRSEAEVESAQGKARRDVVVVDLGMGNLNSVQRALDRAATDAGIACRVRISADADVVAASDVVVVPGQGAFRDCATALEHGGLGDALRQVVARGTPFLGICL